MADHDPFLIGMDFPLPLISQHAQLGEYFPQGLQSQCALESGQVGWLGAGHWHYGTHHLVLATAGTVYVHLVWMDTNGDRWYDTCAVVAGGAGLLVPAQVWHEFICAERGVYATVYASVADANDIIEARPDWCDDEPPAQECRIENYAISR